MQLIRIDELNPHEQNSYFFDDIQGDNWSEFLKSIQTSGVIEPVVITQNKVIVSGHQRVRACAELLIEEIPCEIRIYETEEKILKDLLETNLRQRGIGNTNPIKFARCIVELEKVYGIQHGGSVSSENNSPLKTQKDLAGELGFDESQLRNYKKLLTLIPELQDSIEEGKLSPTVGYKVFAKLSKEDQEKLITDFGSDYISSLTQKKAQELLNEIEKEKENLEQDYEILAEEKDVLQKENDSLEIQLEQALDKKLTVDNTDYVTIDSLKAQLSILEAEKEILETELSSRPTVEKEIAPSDYEDTKKKLLDSKTFYDNLKKDHDSKTAELSKLKEQIRAMTELQPEQQYSEKLKNDTIIFCARVENFISQVGGLAYLADHIKDLPTSEQKAYIKAVNIVGAWASNIEISYKGDILI